MLTEKEARALAVLRDAIGDKPVDVVRRFNRRMLRALRWTPGGGRKAST